MMLHFHLYFYNSLANVILLKKKTYVNIATSISYSSVHCRNDSIA